MNEFIKKLREKHKYNQEEIAKELHISRQSYSLIEQGQNELSYSQIETLSNFYNISKADFINKIDRKIEINIIKQGQQEETDNSIRINIPQLKIEKFKQILLYILAKIGAKPNVGQVVLYKILYFIDFDFYEKYEEQLIGIKYIKNHYGPTPIEFAKVIEIMKKDKEIEEVKSKYFNHEQTKYLPLKNYNLKLLTAIEIQHIDQELKRLSDKNASELSELSHKDIPWIITEDQEEIDYESVFYRTNETSVRQYDNNNI